MAIVNGKRIPGLEFYKHPGKKYWYAVLRPTTPRGLHLEGDLSVRLHRHGERSPHRAVPLLLHREEVW